SRNAAPGLFRRCVADTYAKKEKRMTDSNTNNIDSSTIFECGLSAQAVAWAKEHGSAYLRFCVEEGALCVRIYNEERAQLEAPGWSLLDEAAYQPDHPPVEAMQLLARAREQFPTARLRQICICVEDRDEDEYATIAKFVVVVDEPWPDGQKLVFNDHIF